MIPAPSVLGAMALFALTTSATPGPVNLVGAMTGARFGPRAALPFVTGATVAFVILLLGLGSGSIAGLGWIDALAGPMRWIGAGYLLWLAWRIAGAGATVQAPLAARPGFVDGLLVQGLNPKAWLVSLSAVGTFVMPLADRSAGLASFALLYLVICWAALALWAVLGAGLARGRFAGWINRGMAAVLVASVLWMLAAR